MCKNILKKLLVGWVVFVLSSSMALAETFEHLYGINVKNKDEIHLNLLNSYINNSANKMSSTYFYDNENRYYLAYLAAINNTYAYYYYMSNVNDLKHNEFLKYLDILGYKYTEITSPTYINMYRNNALRQNLFDGKLQAIKNGTFDEYVATAKANEAPMYSTTNPTTSSKTQTSYYNRTQTSYNNQTITIPAGYTIKLFNTQAIALCSITTNYPYTTILANDIYINGKVVIPKGSQVVGIARPHIYSDYNNNYLEVTFNKIITPNGKTYTIRTENLSIYDNIKTQYEYTYDNITYGNNSSSSTATSSTNSSSSNGKLSTGQKVAIGAAAVGIAALIVGGILISSSSNSSSSSSTTSGTTSTTNTDAYRVYRTHKTPEELCPNHNVTIQANSVFDVIITVPVLIN